MGTGKNSTNTEATARITKPPKCSICREVYTPQCDYKQGRCPHHPAFIDTVLNDNYKARFYNLIKFFKGKK
jgi:hypothetical protein